MRTELTIDTILVLPAGRELDALVAERVMGWHRRKRNGVEVWVVTTDTFDPPVTYPVECWNPSTSIAAAWEVVEKQDDCLHLKQHGEKGMWEAYFCHNYCEADYLGEADTAPLAICRAALKAVMND